MKVFIGERFDRLWSGARFVRYDPRSKSLIAISVGWLLSIGVRLTYPVLLPYFRTDYGLSLGAAGLLLTVLWGAFGVGQLPGGILSDRFGERYVLAVTTIASAVMITLVVIAGHPIVLFVTTALMGFATALFAVARYTAIPSLFPDRVGVAMGVTLAAGNVGNVLLPVTIGAVAAASTWQFGLGLTIPLFLIVAVFLWNTIPTDPGRGNESDTVSMEPVRSVLSKLWAREIVVTTVILILSFSIYQAFTGFYPTYLIEEKGLSHSTATVLFSFYFSFGIVIQPFSGAVYDRWGIRRALPPFLAVSILGLVLLPFVDGVYPILGVTVLLSCMLSTIAVTMPYLTTVLPDEIKGTGLGVLRTTYMLFGALSPAVFGAIADLGQFNAGFFLLAALVGVVIILATLIPTTG